MRDTTEIESILDDLDNLHKRMVKWLEEQKNQYTPTIVPIPYDPTIPIVPPTSRCGKCGLELSQVMGYVCSQPNCPTGLGGPTCINSTGQEGHSALTTGKPLC